MNISHTVQVKEIVSLTVYYIINFCLRPVTVEWQVELLERIVALR
jgi:hypothetical protein